MTASKAKYLTAERVRPSLEGFTGPLAVVQKIASEGSQA